jgi:PIN domain nuclease of toxin-antitoxin system
MRYLFDTHSFLWWANEPGKLSLKALELCRDENNILVLSLVSVWEVQIKQQLGKLTLRMPLVELISSQQQMNHIELLSISLQHITALESLPSHHRDPFDRLLVSQANVEKLELITSDPLIAKYPIPTIW